MTTQEGTLIFIAGALAGIMVRDENLRSELEPLVMLALKAANVEEDLHHTILEWKPQT